MGQIRNAPKTSALLVQAIRKLKNIHGSTSREITNYVASECEGPKKNIQRLMKLALRRGLSAGVLRRSKNGYYTCATMDDVQTPSERSRCGGRRRRRRRKKSCGRRRRKSRCGRGRRRRRRGCGMRRRRKSKCGKRRRRRRRCGGRRRGEGVAEAEDAIGRGGGVATATAASASVGKRGGVAGAKGRNNSGKKKNGGTTKSNGSSETRVSSASSGGTHRSGVDTASADLSASGKESLTDQSDVSGGSSDGTAGEAKP